MYLIFSKIVNMSLYGGLFILAVLLLRILLKHAPKRLFMILWATVAFRLFVPLNIGSSFSAFNLLHLFSNHNLTEGLVQYSNTPEKPELFIPIIESQVPGHIPNVYMPPIVQIWILGMAIFVVYAICSYVRIKKKTEICIEDNGAYLCDGISTPFIFGLIRPRIYLPSDMSSDIKPFVLSHENMHLNHGDFIWKPLGYAILTVHWFNPLVWLGFVMFCRDLELACDESVVRNMDEDGKVKYSEVLLSCATKAWVLSPCPVAFGEVGVGERIQKALQYKKPHIGTVAVSIVAVILCGVCFITNPVSNAAADSQGYISYEFETFDGRSIFIDETNIISQAAEENVFETDKVPANAEVVAPGRDFVYLEDEQYFYVEDAQRNLLTAAKKGISDENS